MTRNTRSARDSAAPESMRLDLFLKSSRLIPRRSLAQDVCEHGAISVNGRVAKSTRPVKVGDWIEWRQQHKVTTVKIARIPKSRPSRQEAVALYETVAAENGERFPK